MLGKTYQWPINEESTPNHIHGSFYNRPWEIRNTGISNNEVYVEIVQAVGPTSEVYAFFPHSFVVRIRYGLSERGLTKQALNISFG